MKPWHFAVVGLALLAPAGCRTDPAVPILERELRLKEDEIYRLRAMVDDFQDCGSVISDRNGGGSRSTTPTEPDREPPRRRGRGAPNGANAPAVEMPSQPASGVPDILKVPAGSLPSGIPDVPENLRGPSKPIGPGDDRPGGPATQPSTGRTRGPESGQPDGPALEGNAEEMTSRRGRVTLASRSGSAVPFAPSGDSRRVAAIALNRTLTGGVAGDDEAGDHGLLVVIEPRDRAGRTVDAPAQVSVVVRDEAEEGLAARVGRWDFSAAEIAGMFRRTGGSGAIHLTTVWPGNPPTHNKLHLFVRYVTADGRKLQADAPVEVALPGDRTARWTPNEMSDRRAARDAPESWRPDETPRATAGSSSSADARVGEPPVAPAAPQMATRAEDAKPPRPAWSPDRR